MHTYGFSAGDGSHCSSRGTVQVFRASDGKYLRTMGGSDYHREYLRSPSCVCVSSDALFVADDEWNIVQVFCVSTGWHLETIGEISRDGRAARQFNGPSSMCLSSDELQLFVTDSYNHRVQVFRRQTGARGQLSWRYQRTIGECGNGAGQFSLPTGTCVSPTGDELFIADRARVQAFRASDGAYLRTVVEYAPRHRPSSICVSADADELFVTDIDGNCVQVYALLTHCANEREAYRRAAQRRKTAALYNRVRACVRQRKRHMPKPKKQLLPLRVAITAAAKQRR